MFGKKNEMSGMEQGTDGEERRPIAVLAGKKCQLRIFDLPVTIGRNSEMVDVPLVEYSVSRRHCALELLDGFKAGMEAVLGAGSCQVLSIRPQGGVLLEEVQA